MGYGLGVLLAAVGAILAFAVTTTVNGVNIHTVGWILMIAGLAVIVLTALFWERVFGPRVVERRGRDLPPGY